MHLECGLCPGNTVNTALEGKPIQRRQLYQIIVHSEFTGKLVKIYKTFIRIRCDRLHIYMTICKTYGNQKRSQPIMNQRS